MDRRNFLRTASSFALLAAGATTGVSRVFAEPSSSWTRNSSDENTPNTNNAMEYRTLGGLDVSAIGLGCLPMVGYYGGKYDKKDMITLIRRAYDKGVTFSIRRRSMALIPVKSGSARHLSRFAIK